MAVRNVLLKKLRLVVVDFLYANLRLFEKNLDFLSNAKKRLERKRKIQTEMKFFII